MATFFKQSPSCHYTLLSTLRCASFWINLCILEQIAINMWMKDYKPHLPLQHGDSKISIKYKGREVTTCKSTVYIIQLCTGRSRPSYSPRAKGRVCKSPGIELTHLSCLQCFACLNANNLHCTFFLLPICMPLLFLPQMVDLAFKNKTMTSACFFPLLFDTYVQFWCPIPAILNQ